MGTSYVKITPTIILKPKNINIPEILAKSKKSSDLHDSPKIYRHLHISGKKIPKKGTPLEAKNLVWETFLENQDVAQRRTPTPQVIY